MKSSSYHPTYPSKDAELFAPIQNTTDSDSLATTRNDTGNTEPVVVSKPMYGYNTNADAFKAVTTTPNKTTTTIQNHHQPSPFNKYHPLFSQNLIFMSSLP